MSCPKSHPAFPEHTAFIAEDLSCIQILEHIPGFVYIKDRNGVYLAANDQASFLGVGDGNKTDFELPWKEFAEIYRRNDQAVMDCGETMSFIEQSVMPDGKRAIFYTVKAPYRDKKGNIIGIIGNSIEISQLKGKI